MRKEKIHITFNSPVILIFVTCCLLATALNFLTNGKSNEMFFMTYHSSLKSPMTYVRFFTHVFGHSGWEHFISNAAYLLLLGPVLEEKYGSGRLIKVFAIAALSTGIVNYIFFPQVALCGASGVVFACIILIAFTGVKSGEIPLTLILVIVIFIGQQVYDGLLLQDNISNMAHIVGGTVGAVLGFSWNTGK